MASGLKHLHSLKIVHDDLGSQNVLVALRESQTPIKMLSDLGLYKKLDNDETSLHETREEVVSYWSPAEAKQATRGLTKAIDIFSIGCVFYYFITRGEHPFGNRYVSGGNIIENKYSLNRLENFEEEGNCEAGSCIIYDLK